METDMSIFTRIARVRERLRTYEYPRLPLEHMFSSQAVRDIRLGWVMEVHKVLEEVMRMAYRDQEAASNKLREVEDALGMVI